MMGHKGDPSRVRAYHLPSPAFHLEAGAKDHKEGGIKQFLIICPQCIRAHPVLLLFQTILECLVNFHIWLTWDLFWSFCRSGGGRGPRRWRARGFGVIVKLEAPLGRLLVHIPSVCHPHWALRKGMEGWVGEGHTLPGRRLNPEHP